MNEKIRIVWVKEQIKKIPKGQTIIDVGAGEGRYRKYCGHLKYMSQDFNQYSGEGDGIGLQTGRWDTAKIDIISDITSIPVKNSSYDNVLCTEVLEHVPNPHQAIEEISRILKRKGKLILTAPFCSQTHFSPYFFMTGFSPNWYREVLTNNGFKITKMQANGNYFDYICQELIRLPRVADKYSLLNKLSYLLYIFTIPLVIIFSIISKLSKGSEKQLCFGWQIVAIKEK